MNRRARQCMVTPYIWIEHLLAWHDTGLAASRCQARADADACLTYHFDLPRPEIRQARGPRPPVAWERKCSTLPAPAQPKR